MAESLVVTSKVKEHLAASEIRMSGEVPEQLSERVKEILDKAVERCKENGRATLKPCDL